MLTVCTGWSARGFEEYGRRFLETWARYWPRSVPLLVYVEQSHPVPSTHNIELRNVLEVPGVREALARFDNPRCRGREPTPQWKERTRASGYNYRYDAWKFCRQGFIPHDAARVAASEYLCWLDGDVYTHAPVEPAEIAALLPKGRAVAYLGREPKHSEIGFQLYRSELAEPMLREFRELYASGAVLALKEWHSAFVFDYARVITQARAHNLTPGGEGNVWLKSPLIRWMVHLKGDRKVRGTDPEAERALRSIRR